MKLSELEDSDQILTKDYLDTKLARVSQQIAELETRMTDRLMQGERAQRRLVFGAYGLIFGTYVLIIAAIYIWR
jgi:hypothetical protein